MEIESEVGGEESAEGTQSSPELGSSQNRKRSFQDPKSCLKIKDGGSSTHQAGFVDDMDDMCAKRMKCMSLQEIRSLKENEDPNSDIDEAGYDGDCET